MNKIENEVIINDLIGAWSPSELVFITKLSYESRTNDHNSRIIINGLFQQRKQDAKTWPTNNGTWYSLDIHFEGIQSFSAKDFGGAPKQIVGFDIIDISNKGWENLNFEIEDYENGSISFYCQKVVINNANIAESPSCFKA